MIKVKRVFEPPETGDGVRFLVDRLWPRGIKKDSLELYAWVKDVAPGDSLREWFAHDEAKWDEFRRRYFAELDSKPQTWQALLKVAWEGDVTLLYAARDTEHNNAIALKEYLERRLKA